MNRRRFLAFTGLGVGTAGGYFGWQWYNSPSIPDGMRVKTKHFERDVLTENSPREGEFLEWRAEYQTDISDQREADEEIIADGPVTSFVDSTEFDDSYLLVVQNGMQSEMKLVLEAISRREDGIHVDISIDSPRSGPDDLRIHSLLVRITDDVGGVPEDVSVDIEGYV